MNEKQGPERVQRMENGEKTLQYPSGPLKKLCAMMEWVSEVAAALYVAKPM